MIMFDKDTPGLGSWDGNVEIGAVEPMNDGIRNHAFIFCEHMTFSQRSQKQRIERFGTFNI